MSMTRLLPVLLLALARVWSASAATTNWPFTTASDYILSDSNKIEVADGVAKLKLLSTEIRHTTYDDYLQTNATRSLVMLGPDATLALAKTGSVYASPGRFDSRVMQGGGGNVWQRFYTRVTNKALDVENVSGGITTNESGLVALYRMDNDWVDATTGLAGTPVGSPSFTTHSKFGSHAGYFPGGASYLVMNNSNLLNNASQFTISFWMYPMAYVAGAGLVSARPSGNQLTGFRYGLGGDTLECYVNGAKFLETSKITTGLWYFVTMTWVGSLTDARARIYFNGSLAYNVSTPTYTSIYQDRPYYVNNDYGTYSKSRFDEVAIYNRALSTAEVQELYDRASPAKFQIRSGTALPLTSNFVGPDGTVNTYFFTASTPFASSSDFNTSHTYVQYRAYLTSDIRFSATPYVEAIAFDGTSKFEGDSSYGDFRQGTFVQNTTNLPVAPGTPYLAMANDLNGGVVTNAAYTSRVLDGGSGVTWGQVSWKRLGELTSDIYLLQGLWHLNGTWTDDSTNKLSGGAGVNTSFSDYAKLGLRSAVFNGTDAYATLPATPSTVNTLELWVKNESQTDGLLGLKTGVYLSLSNSSVVATGFSPAPTIYVNARAGAPLLPGWNHIALVTSQTTLTNIALTLGVANGDYFKGMMDEVAVYSRQLEPAEIIDHYDNGRRAVAGRVRLQVRADTNNPPQTAFAGPAALPGYFTDPNGTPIAAFQGQYLQYKVTMDSDGAATPALDSVTITSDMTNYTDNVLSSFLKGTFDGNGTRWCGDEISLLQYNQFGPAAINPVQTLNIAGLWHMDESSWSGGVLDSSGLGYHGTVEGTAAPSDLSRVGPRSGSFPGTTGSDIVIPAIDLSSNDFSVAMWVNSTTASRSGLISTYGAGAYYALELNGDGSAVSTGAVTFVINNGTTTKAAVSDVRRLNDGSWHHVAGVRNGRQIHIYVDGRLAGTTDIGASFGTAGSGGGWFGKHGTLGLYYSGLMDEVVLVRRALTDAEIGSIAAAGSYMLSPGTFSGPVIDSGQLTIWQKLWWGADAPYSRELKAGDAVAGLWHLNAVTNGTTFVDSSGAGHDGTGTVSVVSGGRFSNCVYLAEGQNQHVRVTDADALEQVPFSVEAWINPQDVLGHVIVDKRDAAKGYRLALDASGRPTFWVNGTAVTAPETVRSRKWTHVAGTCDGATIRLYVNGVLKGSAAVAVSDVTTASPLLIGLGYDATWGFFGSVDDVAVFAKTLSLIEVLDHYRAGAVTLKLQARSWTSGGPGAFVGPDGTPATYFTDPDLSALVSAIPLNQYFQYQVTFASEDYLWSPKLQGVRVDTATYPQDDPTVRPAASTYFPGYLLDYSHAMATTNGDAKIRYQLSGNGGANWYYWDGTQWSDVTGFGWDLANPVSTINNNILSFFSQLYPTTGGQFLFKAFLNSTGIDQTALDQVNLSYSTGRIVVTAPNGGERGPLAWLIGVTNIITWTTNGSVSPTVIIEYSSNSGTNWTTVAPAAPNTGSYAWLTPGSGAIDERNNCRIRIRDPNDATVWDMSDADFQLVYRYKIVQPNGGEKWYIGETNTVIWQSPPNVGSYSWLYYNLNGTTTAWARIGPVDVPNIPGITNNTYQWITPTTNNALLSEKARVRITLQGSAAREDWSDNDYVMAGIGFITPDSSTAWRRGTSNTLVWISSGAGSEGVDIAFANDGVSFTNIATAVTNVTGTNSWGWLVTAPNPSPVARFRITARSDSRCRGFSPPFTVADIDIKSPVSTNIWTAGETNNIVWTAGGAGTSVNIYYSTNNGASYMPVAMGVTNLDFPAVNSYPWLVPLTPGINTRVKIQSTLGAGELYAESEAFSIAGIRVTAPNGGEIWAMDAVNAITWEQAAAGGGALIQFSYNDGGTYTNVAGPGYSLEALSYDYAPNFPSLRCRARVQASDTGKTNIFDVSDTYFTVAGLKAVKPVLSDLYTMGWLTTNGIQWYSAGTLADNVNVFYAPEDGAQQLISFTPNNENYPGSNTRDWTPAMTLDPSTKAHLKILAFGVSGSYTGLTSAFTLRGVRVTRPSASSVFRIGSEENINWLSAGFDPAAAAVYYLSTDGGATFDSTPLLGWLTSLDLKTAIWTVGGSAIPTTNAVIKLAVTNDVIPFTAVSEPFTIRGIRVLSPAISNVWNIGSTNTIRFLAAGAGNLYNIYYSQNGTTFDTANPIALNVAMNEGTNTYTWVVESSRQPSATSRIKIQAVTTTDYGVSELFTLGGIKVTKPTSTDIWAIGETNRIEWVSIGTTGTNTIDLIMPGPVVLPITNNWAGTYYNWVVPPAAVGSNLTIRVRDLNGVEAYSALFRIVPEPTIQIVAPAAGEYWKVTDPYTIMWAKAGNMSGTFNVEYSMNDFATSVQILGTPVLTDGVFRLSWTPNDPSKLGPAKIRVTNADATNITDTSSTFYLVPKLTIQSPNGGEQFYALKPTIVEWFTRGNATAFDLYYSTDLVRRTNNWVKANTTPITGKGNDQLSQYLWTVANVKSPVAWIRIQDAGYTTMFPADVPGPYDDCDATFAINYYTITWKVYYEADPTNGLANLSVSDSSGWSASGLTSTPYIVHDYPFGSFDTVWSCQYFFDKIIFNWSSEPARTINVPMRQTEASPEYRVMANFAYDPSNNVFKTVAWLERSSKIVAGTTECAIYVYDPEGNLQGTVVTTTPRDNGTYWVDVPAALDKSRPYFAKVEIKFSGVIHTSGITFTLLTPSESAVAAVNAARDVVLASVSNVNENVTSVNSNVSTVGAAVAGMRQDVTNRLASLSNVTAQISLETASVRTNLAGFSTNALAQLAALTNAIGVIGPGGTNLTGQLAELAAEVDKRTARILTRPSSIKAGTSLGILYRTRPGSGPMMSVFNSIGGTVFGPLLMSELSGGVFELAASTAGWPAGDYQVLCADAGAGGASDRITMKVTAWELDDIAGSMGSVSGQLARVEFAVTNMSASVSNIDQNVYGMTTNLTGLLADVDLMYLAVTNIDRYVYGMATNMPLLMSDVGGIYQAVSNMPGQLAYLTNNFNQIVSLTNLAPVLASLTSSVPQIVALTNMSGQLSYVTNMVGQIGILTNLTPQMNYLTNSMARLGLMTNTMNSLASQMAYVTNVIDTIVVLTNINPAVAAMTSAVAQITVLTNMGGQLNFLTNAMGSVQGLTNLAPQIAALTNLPRDVAVLTNVPAQVASLTNSMSYLTNMISQVSALTNVTPAVSAMTGAVAQISGLTNLTPQVASLTNLPAQMASLTNVPAQLAALTNVPAQMASLTNAIGYLTNVIGQVTTLTNINPAVAAMTGAVAQISGLTNLTPQVASLTNLPIQMALLTNLPAQVTALTNLPAQVNSLAGMVTQLGPLTNLTPQVASLTNSVANIGSQVGYLTNVINSIVVLTNINPAVAAMTGAVAQIVVLTNLADQVTYLTNSVGSLNGITNLLPQVALLTNLTTSVASQTATLTNLVTRMAGLTNLTPQVGYLTNSVATLLGLTNAAGQLGYLTNSVGSLLTLTNVGTTVASMTNAFSQVASLTNMPAQMNYLTNVINQLSGMTNISDQVASMTNAIGQIAAMTNMPAQMNYMTGVVSQLTGITNIGSQVASMTNSIGQIAGLTNFAPQMDYMTGVVSQLTGITNIGSQVASMTNSIGQIAGLTNLYSQMEFLTNAVTRFGDLTNLTVQVASLTNLPGQVSDITNLLGQLSLSTASLTNMPEQLTGMTNIIQQLAGITNIGPQVASMTNAIGQIAAMTNLPSQMNYLTNAMTELTGLTNLVGQMASMTNAISQVAGMTNLPSQMNFMTNVITELANLTNITDQVAYMTNAISQVAAMTNLPSQMNFMTNVITELANLTNITDQVAYMTNAISQVAGMTNLPSQMTYMTGVVSRLAGLTNIGDQVASMTNAIGQVAGMTNLPSQMNYLTNLMASLGSLTNVNVAVASMTNSIAQVAGMTNLLNSIATTTGSLTNMPGQLNALSNAVSLLSGLTNMTTSIGSLTNLAGPLGSLTNLPGQVAGLTNLPTQIGYLTNVVGQLSGMTNLDTQISLMTNAIGQVTTLTNLASQMTYLTNIVTSMGMLTNLPGQVATLTNVPVQVAGLTNILPQLGTISASLTNTLTLVQGITNMPAQLGTLTNVTTQLTSLTNLSTQVAVITNSMDKIATMTNLSTQVSVLTNMPSQVSTLTNVTVQLTTISNLYNSIESRLGAGTDGAARDTVFGRLAAIDGGMSTVGASASSAASKASGARSQANAAAGAAQRIKQEVATGQMPRVMDDLAIIRKSLEAALSQIQQVPGGMSTEEMVKTVSSAAETIKTIAGQRGLQVPGPAEKAEPGALSDPKAVSALLNQLSETKAMMEATRLLMDNAVNKPVVVDWMEGSK